MNMAITPTPKNQVVCPRCGNAQCERIPRSNIVKILFSENTRRYKCEKCFKKFYKTGMESSQRT